MFTESVKNKTGKKILSYVKKENKNKHDRVW